MSDYQLWSLNELCGRPKNPDRWLVKDLIPNPGRVLLYGAGGEYKSSAALDLGVGVASKGQLFEEWPILKTGPAIMLSTEGDLDSNADRIFFHVRARNLHPGDCEIYHGQEDIELDTPSGIALLRAMVESIRPLYVVVDPWVSFYQGNENDVGEVKKFFKPIDRLIREYGITFVVVHHANKKKELRGSTGLQGWADTILRFEKTAKVSLPSMTSPVDIVTIVCQKMRNGKDGSRLVVAPMIDEDVGMFRWGVYDDVEAKRVADAFFKSEVYKLLRAAPEPLSRNQLRDTLGIGQKRLDGTLDVLAGLELVEQVTARRAMGSGNSREVDGWVAKVAKIDVVRAILENRKPKPACIAYALDDEDSGGFCIPGVSKRPRVPKLRAIRGGLAS